MTNAIKAAFLSGLVFPGLGQLSLRRYLRASVLLVTSAVCLIAIIVSTVQQAMTVLEEIAAKGGAADFNTIMNLVSQTTSPGDTLLINGASLILLCCWIGATVDAYRIGKTMDLEGQSGS